MHAINIRILEILTSKVCHDLISPIGAVNNGIEFVTEMGIEDAGDAFDLIKFSAQQASAKLQAFRMAYGAGGADNSIKPEDVYAAIQNIVGAEEKIKQEWDGYAPIGMNPETAERPTGFAKILISSLLLAMDSLPKGGVLKVEEEDAFNITVIGEGENANFKEHVPEALSLSIHQEQLEPKCIHAYVMGLLCEEYGFEIALDGSADNSVSIAIKLPS